MRVARRRTLAALATLVLGTWTSGLASVVVPLSLVQLTTSADVIVDGTVVDVQAVQGPDGTERLVQVRVASTWKGTPAGALYVRLAGGRMGRTVTRIPGVPDPSEGDRVVWFLVAHPRGGFSVVGLYQGALAALPTPDGTARVLAPATEPSARGEVTRLPRRIADLEADVRLITGHRATQ